MPAGECRRQKGRHDRRWRVGDLQQVVSVIAKVSERRGQPNVVSRGKDEKINNKGQTNDVETQREEKGEL